MSTPTPAPARKLNLGRLERLQRLLQYGAALVLLVFMALIVVASVQLKTITARVQNARLAEDDLKANINALTAQSDNLQAKVEERNNTLFKIRTRSPEAREWVDEAVKETSEKSAASSAQLTPLIYIQIERADQMPKARELTGLLKAEGYSAPGIENVGERPAERDSEIRYCDGDATAQDLDKITGLLSSAGVRLVRRKLSAAVCAKIRARQYELWFFDDFPPGRTPPADQPRERPGLEGRIEGRINGNVNRATNVNRAMNVNRRALEYERPGRP